MNQLIDFTNAAQVQNYLLAVRALVTELQCLKSDSVAAVLLKYNVHAVYAPGDPVPHRLNVDFPADQVTIAQPTAAAVAQ